MAERLRASVRKVETRLRASLREAGLREAPIGAILLLALSLLAVSLSVVWYGVLSSRQAAEQAIREEAPAPPGPQPENFPLVFEPGSSLAEITSADGRLRGIPGLSDMEVIGNLQHFPGTNFRCPGGSPYRGFLTKRTCTSSTGEDPSVVYEVTIIEESPRTVLSVQATARNAPDEETVDFLAYVAGLSLKDAAPSLDAEAWVDRNIESGGQYFADGAEARLYGTPGDRTLEIVAIASPREQGPGTGGTTRAKDGGDRNNGRDGKAKDRNERSRNGGARDGGDRGGEDFADQSFSGGSSGRAGGGNGDADEGADRDAGAGQEGGGVGRGGNGGLFDSGGR